MVTILFSLLYGTFLGLAMSVDAFMFSLIYGLTLNRRREAIFTALIVGLFHFIMPLIGYYFTFFVLRNVFSVSLFQNQMNNLGSFILLLLGLFMLYKKEEVQVKTSVANLLSTILFAFSVSIDSFFIGVALTTNDKINIIIIAILFLFISSFLTYLALRIIHHTKKHFILDRLNILAGIILIFVAIMNLFLK